MNIRFAIITLFFALFIGLTGANAQEYISVNGLVRSDDIETRPGEYDFLDNKEIDIYVFLNQAQAAEALKALKAGKRVKTAENNNIPYHPNSDGKINIPVPRGGCVLFWTNDGRWLDKNEATPDKYIKKFTNYINFNFDAKQSITIDSVVVSTKRNIAKASPSNTALEGPDGMVRSFMFEIPYNVTEDMRIVVQPILYDRNDISDVNSDVIHAYGRATFFDMEEYHLTQERRMNFDLNNDTLIKVIKTQADVVFHEDLKKQESIKKKEYKASNKTDITPFVIEGNDTTYTFFGIEPYVFVKNDTIKFYAVDRFKGFDPDTSHPYPYGVFVSIGGYNTGKIDSVVLKDKGERRDPLRFLSLSFKEFLPDRDMFEETMPDQRIDHSGELKLNFEVGKSVLVANDTASHNALKVLEKQLRAAQNPDNGETLHKVAVYGIASPDGNLKKNKELAYNRANFALKKVRSYISNDIPSYINNAIVAGWDVLADSLRKGGYENEADAIYEIVQRFPVKNDNDAVNFANQEREIKKLSFYNELIKKEYLPKLRAVKYNFSLDKMGQLPTDTVIARYKRNPDQEFLRGEYWSLFDNLESDLELEKAAKIALEKTRNNDSADSVHCQGYWPYAAAVLACCYIRRDTVDLDLLKPFFDFTLYKDTVTGKEELKLKEKIFSEESFTNEGKKRIVGYINFPDMAANQLIMTLNSKEYNSKSIAMLEGLIAAEAEKEPAYDQLLAFSMCLRGKYNGTEEKYVRARELVANSSPQNYVVMALAMDNPATTSDDAEWLHKAVAKVDSLEQNLVTKYLKSVVNIRLATDSLLNNADTLLAECFTEDIKFLLMGSNDADLVVRSGSQHNVFVNATKIWNQKMSEMGLGEEHPFTWFQRAMVELKNGNPKERLIKQNLNKCFSLDESYITVLNIYMRDCNDFKDNKDVLIMLRRIRDKYIEKN